MKFFIPEAKDIESEHQILDSILTFVSNQMEADLSGRRIQFLVWTHDGKKHVAEVGEPTSANDEIVLAILFDVKRNLYYVCTYSRGVARGMPILASGSDVLEVRDFNE